MDWIAALPVSVLVGEWAIRVVMLVVILNRDDRPVTGLAWLTVVFFVPWIGLLLYVLVGESRIVRKRAVRRRHGFDRVVSSSSGFRWTKGDSTGIPDVMRPLSDMAAHVGGSAPTSGNDVHLVADSDVMLSELIRDIDEAEHHVHLLYYIFEEDDAGNAVMEALTRAAARGVQCRLAVDDVGSWDSTDSLARRAEDAGVEFATVMPVHLLRRGLARFDMRNHRKLAVIDGRIAWCGSQNMVVADYGSDRAGPWLDVSARVSGPVVHHIQRVFAEDWYHETEELLTGEEYFADPGSPGDVWTQLVPSGPDHSHMLLRELVVQAVHLARSQITVITPYFVPDEPLLTALRMAAIRGVDVRILVPARSDTRLVDAAGWTYCNQLIEAGARVFRHERGMPHAKTLTVDDHFAMIGSANMDMRSFFLNFEVSLLLYDVHCVEELRRIQNAYAEASAEQTKEDWQRRGILERTLSRAMRLFSPLL